MGALTVADLVPGDAEPRIKDLVLAERLGFAKSYNIRRLITGHEQELLRYGAIFSTAENNSGGRGRAGRAFHLNEAQALLICMLSETERAADVREEVIKVYLAWRRGDGGVAENLRRYAAKSLPSSDIARFERQPLLASALLADATIVADAQRFARALPHLLEAKGRMRMPGFWADFDVRTILIATHRQMTFDDVRRLLFDNFSADRVPSRGAIGRFWLELDKVRRG